MIKHMIVLVCSSLLFWAIHSQLLPSFFDTGSIALINTQHILLCSITSIAYGMVYIASRRIPTNTGFVCLGVLILKVGVATVFIQNQGWLEDSTTFVKRALFLGFYLGYTGCLLLLLIKVIKRTNP